MNTEIALNEISNLNRVYSFDMLGLKSFWTFYLDVEKILFALNGRGWKRESSAKFLYALPLQL